MPNGVSGSGQNRQGMRKTARPAGKNAGLGTYLLLACALCFPGAGQDAKIQQPNIRVDVNLVTLRFSVKDSRGNLINNLSRADFQVFEDRLPQEVVFFETPRNTTQNAGPLRVAFLIDVSGSTFATRDEEIAAAATFLENVDHATRVGVFGFTDKLILFQDFTSNRELALKALRAVRKHMGRTAIYGSLDALIGSMSTPSSGPLRNAIIVISDGMDTNYRKAAQTLALAQDHQAVIYTILVPSAAQLYIPPSPPSQSQPLAGVASPDDAEAQKRAFASLSLRSNGKHFSGFEAILNFDDVMAQINDDIFGNLYSVGYYTDDPHLDKRQRNIQVRIGRADAHIPARFENLPERLTAKKRLISALFDNQGIAQLPENLHRTFHEIGAELDLLTSRRQGGKLGLPFRIKISPYSLRASEKGGIQTQFGVIGLLLDEEGNEVVRLREVFRVDLNAKAIRDGRGIIYTNKLFAPPGRYALKLALLEMQTWRMTAFESVVRIKDR